MTFVSHPESIVTLHQLGNFWNVLSQHIFHVPMFYFSNTWLITLAVDTGEFPGTLPLHIRCLQYREILVRLIMSRRVVRTNILIPMPISSFLKLH